MKTSDVKPAYRAYHWEILGRPFRCQKNQYRVLCRCTLCQLTKTICVSGLVSGYSTKCASCSRSLALAKPIGSVRPASKHQVELTKVDSETFSAMGRSGKRDKFGNGWVSSTALMLFKKEKSSLHNKRINNGALKTNGMNPCSKNRWMCEWCGKRFVSCHRTRRFCSLECSRFGRYHGSQESINRKITLVRELVDRGHSPKMISECTGIPYPTIITWRRKYASCNNKTESHGSLAPAS